MTAAAVPRRCCLCIRCRTALFAGGTCDCDGAPVVACFEVAEERAAIVKACWGDASAREEIRRVELKGQRRILATSMGGFSLGGTVAYGLAGLGPGVLVWGMLSSLTGGILARHKGLRERKPPTGARPQSTIGDVSLRGTVVGDHDLVSPASAEACLAYSLELRVLAAGGERVMYRDAITSGFVAHLGSGESVEIPAGRLRFADESPELLDVDNLELEAYLEEVDPLRDLSEELHPLHFNLVREEVLFSGDAVELGGAFERTADVRDSSWMYREAGASQLLISGVPVVRRLR